MDQQERDRKLQEYVRRLSKGEDLEAVRKDFVANFQDVDPSEIMKAEQDLMKGGVSYQDVQKLCDVHSALFHGTTQPEKIANAEAAVKESLQRQNPETGAGAPASVNGKALKNQAVNKMSILSMSIGHPVNIFTKENEAIGKKISEIQAVLNDKNATLQQAKDKFEEIRPLSIHYAKKGDLLYPLLKSRYGISGPSDVMWGVDDEIRDEIRALSKDGKDNLTEENWRTRAGKVLTRAQEMIYKEQNILLPICVQNFSDTEWKQMARDIQDYEPCLTKRIPLWRGAEDAPVWAESPENNKARHHSVTNSAAPVPEAAAHTETKIDGSTGAGFEDAKGATLTAASDPATAALVAAQAALKAAEAALAVVNTNRAVKTEGMAANAGSGKAEQDKDITTAKEPVGSEKTLNTSGGNANADDNGEIVLPTGHFTREQLRWVLNTLPVEISFVDDKDINRYFNEGEKYFKRPLQALDREVYYCHPKKIEGMVRMMIQQFREGTRKSFEVWMEKMGHTFLVRYLAVYDDKGKFIGTMECVENMDEAKKHFGGKEDAAQKPEW